MYVFPDGFGRVDSKVRYLLHKYEFGTSEDSAGIVFKFPNAPVNASVWLIRRAHNESDISGHSLNRTDFRVKYRRTATGWYSS